MSLNYSILANKIYFFHQQLHSASVKKKLFHFQDYSQIGLTRRVRFHLFFTSVILSQGFRKRLDNSSLSLLLSVLPMPSRSHFSLLPYSVIVLCSVNTQDSITYLSGCRVDMDWRSSPCALSIIFLLGPIWKWKLYSGRLGQVGINEKMGSEEIDRLITDFGSRDVGRKTDSHLLFLPLLGLYPLIKQGKIILHGWQGNSVGSLPTLLPAGVLYNKVTIYPVFLGTIPIPPLS